MEHNARDMERRAGGKPIRLASKSVRCRALQERVLARDGFRGTLAFTLPEALWLASEGTDDILVAYPTADAEALRELAAGAADVTVMVDSAEGLRLIDRALEGAPGGTGLRLPGHRRRLARCRRAHARRRAALARPDARARRRDGARGARARAP